ncbi:MAG: NAD-dependent deacylase [Acidobacteriota bacterium]
MDLDAAARAADALAAARRVSALTGAGVSAESGVPTFRGPGGLWEGRRPEELASPVAFAADPELVWRFYDWRRTRLAGARPNAAHRALARLEQLVPSFELVTQNVDGLHAEAGSRRVVELHGNIWRVRCPRGCVDEIDRTAPLPPPLPPRCPRCRGPLRPGVVWFGEALPPGAFEAARRAAESAEVFLVVGTSGVVEPAASLARLAAGRGALVVEINPDVTALTDVAAISLRAGAGEALSAIVDRVEEARR